MTSKNVDSAETLAERIEKSKREKEELKAKLQNLIDSGINSSLQFTKILDNSHSTEQNPATLHSTNKVQIIRSYDPNHSQRMHKSPEERIKQTKGSIQKEMSNKRLLEDESPKKARNYNVEEAREYIKKQREKRLEELKSKKKENVNITELQKQKLQELHKKSLELVAKNVNAKRERSKSRERGDYVRPDTKNLPSKQRSISRERLNEPKATLGPSRSLSCDKIHKLRDKQPFPKLKSPPRDNSHNIKKLHESYVQAGSKTPLTKLTEKEKHLKESCDFIEKKGISEKKKCPDLLYPPNHHLYIFNSESPEIQNVEPTKKTNFTDFKGNLKISVSNTSTSPSDKKSKNLNILSNITLRKPEGNIQISKNCSDNIQNNDNKITNNQNLSVNDVFNYKTSKNTKETQTNLLEPVWLKQSVQTDPFNFINAVRRKLQDAIITSKSTNDIGIQAEAEGSLETVTSSNHSKKHSNQKTSEKSNKHSDLKSFISHKCLDLDPRSIRHMELRPRNSNNEQLLVQQNIPKTNAASESESDTSKNIPEISSESATSLKQKVSGIHASDDRSNLKINTHTIDNLKLKTQDVKHIASDATSNLERYFSDSQGAESFKNKKPLQKIQKTSSSKPVTKTIEEDVENNLYSSDFHSSTTNLTTDLSKSRDSIISYNKSNYSKISPVKPSISPIQSHHSSGKISGSLSIPSAISIHTKISYPKSVSEQKTHLNTQTISSQLVDPVIVPSHKEADLKESSVTTEVTAPSSKSEASKKSQFKSLYSELQSSPFEEIISHMNSSICDKVDTNSETSNANTRVSSSVQTESKSINSGNEINTEIAHSNSNAEILTTEKLSSKTNFELQSSQIEDLHKKENKNPSSRDKIALMKNVSLRSFNQTGDLNNTNEIHLKFEAEIHLLNDFNESLKHFAEVEKAFHSLRVKNDIVDPPNEKSVQHRDTQTSARIKDSKSISSKLTTNISEESKSQISTINYTRGSDVNDDVNSIVLNSSVPKLSEDSTSLVSLDHDFSHNSNTSRSSKISEVNKARSNGTFENFENLFSKDFAGMSLSMFDQLIRDEDVRIQNLKTILKIREQALLDRTKAELAWLEIQRKHLKETGKLQEASLVKKKQRGILLKHQQERHEMHRLKQMQKAESIERKTILKAQRNIIKHQLSTENMLSKIKMNASKKSKHPGPLKVIQTHSESIRSETSISVKSSPDVDIHSVTSHSYSVISKVSEISDKKDKPPDFYGQPGIHVTQVKRTLLMRESALQKRRKAAEELLKWHKKLLEEEKRIKELEETTSSIISQIPNVSAKANSADNQNEGKYKFKGHQLNQLWLNLTGSDEKKFKEDKVYPMSQMALERFCKSAKEYSHKSKDILKKVESDVNSTKANDNVNALGILNLNQNIPRNTESPSGSLVTDIHPTESFKQSSPSTIPSETSTNEYTSDFDVDIATINEINARNVEAEEKSNISSISELIDNFSKIKTDISALRITQEITSELEESIESLKTDQSELDRESQEVSVIETTKASRADTDLPQSIPEETGSQIILDELETDKTSEEPQSDTTPEMTAAEIVITKSQKSESVPVIDTVDEPSLEEPLCDKVTNNEKSETTEILTEEPKCLTPAEESVKTKTVFVDVPNRIVIGQSATLPNYSESQKKSDNKQSNAETVDDIDYKLITEAGSKLTKTSDKLESQINEDSSKIENNTEQPVETLFNKEDINAFEEKEQDSLSSIQFISTDKNEDECNKESSILEEKSIEESISSKEIEECEGKEIEIPEWTSAEKSVPSEKIEECKDQETEESTQKYALSEKTNKETSVIEETPLSSGKVEIRKKTSITEEKTILDSVPNENAEDSSSKVMSYSVKLGQSDEFVASEAESPSKISTDELKTRTNSSIQSEHEISVSLKSGSDKKSPKIDIKRRVSEILADASPVSSREDKSPRLQDLYTTTYDLVSPTGSPEIGSPTKENKLLIPKDIFGTEAEELLKKQLAIEQEIKEITEQQQKEQLPYLFVREIPNKPPPPYTPPGSTLSSLVVTTILPTNKEVEEITKYSAKIIHKAYLNNNLEKIMISDNTLNLIAKNIDKVCYKFVFDLCKEIAIEHYSQFKKENVPAWLQINSNPQLAVVKPLDAKGLEKHMNKKLLEIFGFKTPEIRENTIMKWSRKKRDHVDEILVIECRAEEPQWTNFEKDELLVMNKVTDDIMDVLLKESTEAFSKALCKKGYLY